MKHFDPMRKLTEEMNMPPEKVEILTGKANRPGNAGFGACLLEMLGDSKTAALMRTVIQAEPIIGENYYRNVLMLYGAGFDQGLFRFDRDGRLVVSREAVNAKPLPAPEKKAPLPSAEKDAADAEATAETEAPADKAEKPAPKTEAKADVKPEAKAESKAEAKPEVKPEEKAEVKTEAAPAPEKADAKAEGEASPAPAAEPPASGAEEGARK